MGWVALGRVCSQAAEYTRVLLLLLLLSDDVCSPEQRKGVGWCCVVSGSRLVDRAMLSLCNEVHILDEREGVGSCSEIVAGSVLTGEGGARPNCISECECTSSQE